MSERPIACALGPDELRRRKGSLLPGVAKRALDVALTDAGLTMTFAASGDTLLAIAQAIDAERRCCPFLRFRLEVDGGEEVVRLDISGPAGTREFLTELIAAGG